MSTSTTILFTAETGVTLLFASGVFLMLFLWLLYAFWNVKNKSEF